MNRPAWFSTLLAVFCTCIYVPLAAAGEFDYQADLSYSEANPDYSAFDNGEGLTWHARITYAQSIFAFVRQSDADFQPSGKVSGAEIENWREAGIGYQLPISEQWLMEATIAHHQIKQNGDKESGKGYQLGLGYRPIESLGFRLNVGKVDVKISDWTLVFETDYQITDHVYFIARLRDYADWDLTYYEGGFGLRF